MPTIGVHPSAVSTFSIGSTTNCLLILIVSLPSELSYVSYESTAISNAARMVAEPRSSEISDVGLIGSFDMLFFSLMTNSGRVNGLRVKTKRGCCCRHSRRNACCPVARTAHRQYSRHERRLTHEMFAHRAHESRAAYGSHHVQLEGTGHPACTAPPAGSRSPGHPGNSTMSG